MFFVYILYSSDYNKIYIGQSSDVGTRVHYHNEGPRKGWTARYRPWKLIYEKPFNTRTEAIKRERELKSARGRRWIWEELVNKVM